MDFSETNATATVIESFSNTPNPRLRRIMTSLVTHLHDFVRDIEPSQSEWDSAIEFLTAVGHMCDDVRQEFILLSDVLGVSMLVDAINNRKTTGTTESTVLGPFHVVNSPTRDLGADIALIGDTPRCVVYGRVQTPDGTPLSGAVIDVWQADADGFYDIQRPDVTPELNLRGLFTTDSEGKYWFQTVVPRFYPIPEDGPVGELLRRTSRHPNRPAHIHFIAQAEGHQPVTTHLFVEGSPFLDDDTVFGVKHSLVRPVHLVSDELLAAEFGVGTPFQAIEFDIVLEPKDRGAE